MRRKALWRGVGVTAAVLAVALLIPTAQAQDVIVFPPQPASSGTQTAPAENSQTILPLSELPPEMQKPALARAELSENVAAPVPHQTPFVAQCQANADCVVRDNGCGMLVAINSAQEALWRARLPQCIDNLKIKDQTTAAVQGMKKNKGAGCIKRECVLLSSAF